MNHIEAMKLALDALETLDCGDTYKTHSAAAALRRAIEQEEKQEPVCWLKETCSFGGGYEQAIWEDKDGFPVYTAPPKQEQNVYGDGNVYRGVRSKDSQTKTVYYTAEKQEPYGYFQYSIQLDAWVQNREKNIGTAFYTAPPRDSWFKLTDAEVWDEWTRAVDESNSSNRVLAFRFARALEDKLKEKNT